MHETLRGEWEGVAAASLALTAMCSCMRAMSRSLAQDRATYRWLVRWAAVYAPGCTPGYCREVLEVLDVVMTMRPAMAVSPFASCTKRGCRAVSNSGAHGSKRKIHRRHQGEDATSGVPAPD